MFEETSRDSIPAGLATMDPGVVLGAFLSAVDRSRLNGHELVKVMRAQARQVAYVQAELLATIAEVAYCSPGGPESAVERDQVPVEYAADEIRVALGLTRRAAEAEVGLALRLIDRLPRVWGQIHDGAIDLRRARVIVDGTDHLDETTARRVADRVLEDAGDLTTGQLRALVARMSIDVDPESATERYKHSVAERRVIAEPNTDGTASLVGLQLSPERVTGVMRRINRIARTLRGPDEDRSMDQLRADAYLDILDGFPASASTPPERQKGRTVEPPHNRPSTKWDRGTVSIHVNLATLTTMDDHAGDIPGWGPVIADIARQVAVDQMDAEWRATVTDDVGRVLWNGTTRRRPTITQTRRVHALHSTCIFPGCRMPATDCDLDHRKPWTEGGPTTCDNLAPLCRHDHRVKGSDGWGLERESNGNYQWTTPLGHAYTTAGVPP